MNAPSIPFVHSLRGRLLLFLVVPMVVIFGAVIVFRAVNSFSVVREQAQLQLRNLAEQVATEVERGNTRAVLAAQMMAFAQEQSLFGRRAESSDFARRVLEEYPEFTGAYFGYEPDADHRDAEFARTPEAAALGPAFDAEGRFIPYWFRDDKDNGRIKLTPLIDMESSLYYDGCRRLYLQNGRALPMVTEPYVYEGKMIVEQTYPIAKDGRFVGVAGVDRALSDIAEFLDAIARTRDADVFLISSRGRFIASTLGLGLRTKDIQDTEYSELFMPFYEKRAVEQSVVAPDPITGSRCYYATAPVPTGDWQVVLRESEDQVIGPIRANVLYTTSVAFAGLLVVVGLAWWFSSSASRRIQHAMEAAERVASGDLTAELVGKEKARDEIGSMFRSFNRVVGSYRQVSEVCTAIAAGDFSRRVTRRSANDSLADAINLMAERRQSAEQEVKDYTAQLESRTTELEEMTRRSEERATIESSLSALNASLRGDLSVGEAAENGLAGIVDFLDAPAGALFVAGEDDRLIRLATHAYPEDPNLPTSCAVGSGTVGQAAESRRPIVNAPGQRALRVSFGFGDIAPSQVLAYPLIANDNLVGVAELCLFASLTETQSKWLASAAELMANAIRFAMESDERKEAEERTRLLLESAAEGIFGVDVEGRITFVNPAACRMLGFAAEELVGHKSHALIHHSRADGGEYPVEECPMYAAYTRGETCRIDDEFLWLKDGSGLPVEYGATPILNDGKIVGAVISFSDITERKEAERRLRETERFFRSVLESAPDGMMVVDAGGTIRLVNVQVEQLFGYTRDELIDRPVEMLVPEAVRERHVALRNSYINDSATRDMGASIELTAQHKDGSLIPVEIGLSPVHANEQTQIAVSIRDISERRRAQAQLQKLSSAVEQSPCSVVITDVKGRIEYVNPKFTQVTGYLREEAIGENPRVLKSGEHPPEFYEDLWKTINSGREWHGEFCNRKKNGELYWEAASISPIRDADGNPQYFVAVKEDVTERKQAEQALIEAQRTAEAATQAKSDFLANMSHEIRTPMNGIIGMTDLALDTELTPEQRDYLNTVKTSADALLSLINDILDFSKIEAGKLELEPIDFALRDSLADMLNTLAMRAHSKGLELIYDVSPDVHDALIGDVYRLRQIIVNLVGNAIKFTEKGEIVVAVEALERSEKEMTLHFSVRDTGIGIPADKVEAIFKPFEQADVSTTRRYGGTGLGLTISVQLVGLMGGRIWAESELGVGSTFHFTAVLGIGKAVPAAEMQQRRELLDDLPVLVVDDNDTNRRILEEMLKNWHMKPKCVGSGEAALAALDRAANAGARFRLILSDMHMPGMDGLELFEHTRSATQHKNVPYVLLTSGSRPGDVARCREIGVAAHLLKPVKQSMLLNAIVTAVAGQEMAVDKRDARPRLAAAEPGRALRILLAEDNAVNQKFAVRVIEKAGHSVVVANNGREALDVWQREAFDVVLMDVQMPEMDGFTATARIRDLEKERGSAGRTPIIAMTANAMKGDRERCLEAGMDGYISKPVKRETMFAEIERVLAP